MASLSDRQRARLPASAFAYIDSRGRRLLPIHDEAHVRNALARFTRTSFEDEAARDAARRRLLRAARRFGIVPDGFIAAQLEPHRHLPRGTVTLLFADLEGSTQLLDRLGERYARLLAELRRLIRNQVRRSGGREVDARADEFFAVFERTAAGVGCAAAIQRAVAVREWSDGERPRLRIGVHTGRPTLTSAGYVGLAVNVAARICAVAHGGQVIVSATTAGGAGADLPADLQLRPLGAHRLRGVSQPVELLQVVGEGIEQDFPPLRSGSPA